MPVFKRYGPRLSVSVREIMSSPPISVGFNASLNDAIKLMWDKNVGSILIVGDDGKLVGIITERDVIFAAAKGLICKQGKALDIASKNIVTTSPDEDVKEAVEKMRQFNIRHLPVIDGEGKPVGVLSMRDIIDAGVVFMNVLHEPG